MEKKQTAFSENGKCEKNITFAALGRATNIEATRLRKYIRPCGKQLTLHTAVRIAAAMHVDCEQAMEIVHAAGYDISYDTYASNETYRKILSGVMTASEINRLLFAVLGEFENGTAPYLCGWIEDM